MRFTFLLLYLVMFSSCSGSNVKKSRTLCPETNNEMENRHVVISAKSQSHSLARCFKNYLKFEKDKKQTIKVCNVLNVAKSGKVTYSKAFGLGKRLPKDFQMCLEQEYWMMNFSKLQLDKPAYIKFPLEFKSL